MAVIQNFETNLSEELFGDLNPGITKSDKLAVYSGNTFHQKDAKACELRPGDTVDGIEVVLPLTGLHSVQGLATGKDGAALNFGVVNFSDTADPTISFHTNIQENGDFRFIGIPEGMYEIKIFGGLIVENPYNSEFSEDQLPAAQSQVKPIRAFAEIKVGVIVQTTDIDNIPVTLADTEPPERTAPQAGSETSSNRVVVLNPQ